MTNKILFIANWKMFGDLNSVKSIQSVINLSKKKNYKNAKIIYCPPYTLLNNFVIKTRKTNLDVGAQNCHYEINTGPFTGSISSTMIKKLGAKYVIIGHSENRSNGETNNLINKKIHSAILNNLNVIFCIGENLFEKKNKKTNKILKRQIDLGLKKIVITLGEKGVFYTDGKKEIYLKASPVKAIDTTGAGDAFNGGLVYGLLKNKSIEDILKLANKVAGLSTTKLGAGNAMPSINDLEDI